MRILALFLDMIGGEYINICNPEEKSTSFDKLIRDIGGKVYTNCYTPAPDTPRSSACMWTGVYPRENNCNIRVKWPKRDLNPDIDNIWKVLKDLNYRVNIFICPGTDTLGLMPLYGSEHIYRDSVYQFMENVEVSEDSFNFIYLPDVHYILGEKAYCDMKEAMDFVTDILRQILDYYGGADYFDYIMMFSDHGFQKEHEEHLLSKSRTHTFLFERNKGDKEIRYDVQLRSNMDIFPTLCEKIGYIIKNNIDGMSLSVAKGHEYLLMEDMEGFSTNISQTIEHWGIVLPNGDLHWLECDGYWTHSENADDFNEEYFVQLIEEKMTGYSENHKMYYTAALYKQYSNNFMITERYSTGEKFCKLSYRYPDISEMNNKKILLYGAGNVGKDYFQQFKESGNCYISGWVDRNYKELRISVNNMILGISSIQFLKYDCIVIAIANRNIAMSIRQLLQDLDVDEEKIIWRFPQIIRIKE